MKRIHLLIALLACAGFMSAQDAVPSVPQSEAQATAAAPSHKFGYLSYNEVMLAMPEYTQAIKSLEELKNTYDQEMVRAEQDFTKKFTEFLDGQKSFPENIMLKRQKIMTESLSSLDKKMNEMMIRNAQNTVETAKTAMQLSSQTSISAETLETTWKTIVNGIDEVNKINSEGSKKRIEDAKKLEKIKSEFNAKFGSPSN